MTARSRTEVRLPVCAARAQRGFTLIELTVVIVVIALLLGSLLVPLNSQVQQRNVTQTQRRLEEAREALIGYAMLNGRLPRPAVSDTNGSERTAQCLGAGANAECTGYLPWAELGIERTDAWGKLIRYSVTPALANDAITLGSNGNKYVKTYQGGAEVILADDAAAVLISHGSRNWGRTVDGISVADGSTTNLSEDANAGNDGQSAPFWSRAPSDNTAATGGEFDDQVVILPQTLVVGRLVAAGKLP